MGFTGQIIFLNGTSSSGKSTIAAELLSLLEVPYFHLAVDAFGAMRSVSRTNALAPDELAPMFKRTRMGFHRAVAGMAQAGNGIVVDHVLSERWRLLDCLAVLRGYDVVLVGVHCPLAELERREQTRGDRAAGVARHQFDLVHEHAEYDLECDTSVESPGDTAARIVEFVARGPADRAFDRLRRKYLDA